MELGALPENSCSGGEYMKPVNTPSSDPVRAEVDERGIAQITIDRPERRNALSFEVKNLLVRQVERLSADDTVRCIILTGSGGYFVAGADIAEMLEMTPTEHTLKATDAVFNVLRDCPKPLIAAVEGYALGGGCELALCCDIILAGRSAKFGQPEIRVGIMPGAGGTQRLLRTIGKYQTAKMVLTGEPVDAEIAFCMGIVSELCADGQALERARAMAGAIAKMPPLAVRSIKELLALGHDASLPAMLALERRAFQLLFDTEDQKEGMRAFLEKRLPEFSGR